MDPEEHDDGLDAALGAALDEQAEGGAPPEREYARDDSGKFARKEQTTEETPSPDAAPAAPVDGDKAPSLPKTWSPLWWKNEFGEWEKMPEGLRKQLEQREREAQQGINERAQKLKTWEPIEQFFSANAQRLQQAGVTGQQYVSNLINADEYIRNDPAAGLKWLAESYGIDLYQLADWAAQQGGQQPARNGGGDDQYTKRLEQRLAQLEQRFDPARIAQEEQRKAAEQHVAAWAKDKPYFAELRADMGALSTRYPEATLDELYERAMWAHPTLRQRIQSDQRAQEVQRARAAAVSPRTSSSPPGQAKGKTKQSLDDALNEALNDAFGAG